MLDAISTRCASALENVIWLQCTVDGGGVSLIGKSRTGSNLFDALNMVRVVTKEESNSGSGVGRYRAQFYYYTWK